MAHEGSRDRFFTTMAGLSHESRDLTDPEHGPDEKLCQDILAAVNTLGIAPTAVPAVALHLYNFAKRNELSEDIIKREAVKLTRLTELETEQANPTNLLPTIGIELEVPNTTLNDEKLAVLKQLNIPNLQENERLNEVNPNFSYSTNVQVRILHELKEMGALPAESGQDNLMPLHVNIGLPIEVDRPASKIYASDIRLISDVIAYGYTSAHRIESQRIKDEKMKAHPTVRIHDFAQPTVKNEWTPGVRLAEHLLIRWEFIIGEFRGASTYRMLSEVQTISAMLIAYIKRGIRCGLDPGEEDLANLWEGFKQNVENAYGKFEIGTDLPQTDPKRAISLITSTDLPKQIRSAALRYTRAANKVIQEAVIVGEPTEEWVM